LKSRLEKKSKAQSKQNKERLIKENTERTVQEAETFRQEDERRKECIATKQPRVLLLQPEDSSEMPSGRLLTAAA
jgi:molecular chaperone DnaK (HSP70)